MIFYLTFVDSYVLVKKMYLSPIFKGWTTKLIRVYASNQFLSRIVVPVLAVELCQNIITQTKFVIVDQIDIYTILMLKFFA